MSSVLIKGMEMPECCGECFMDPPCSEEIGGDINIWKDRHPDCPLVEVETPHGRLIDADETIRIWEGATIDGSIKPIIEARPTVIEAEGETE